MANQSSLPPKILVVSLDNLGDAVMATSILKPLREIFPDSQIGMFVKKYVDGLLDDHPRIQKIHLADPFWDTAPGVEKGSLSDYLAILKSIRKENYTHAFILNTEWR